MKNMNTRILNETMMTYIQHNPWIIVLVVWSAVWKLIAMWKAAKTNNLTMFIVLPFVNTLGLLEMIYLGYLYFKAKKGK